MSTRLRTALLSVLTWLLAACSAPGAAAPSGLSLAIDGDVQVRFLSMGDLTSLGPVDVEWTHKDETRTYRAVSLESVLRSVGVDPGAMGSGVAPSEKRAGWKFAVVATASDGFQAVFSVAEVFAGMGPTHAYVAIGEGGNPLDETVGPLRLVVPTDGEGSRSVRNLQRLTIVDLRRRVPSKRTEKNEKKPMSPMTR